MILPAAVGSSVQDGIRALWACSSLSIGTTCSRIVGIGRPVFGSMLVTLGAAFAARKFARLPVSVPWTASQKFCPVRSAKLTGALVKVWLRVAPGGGGGAAATGVAPGGGGGAPPSSTLP
jgi:hypothetical protein